MELMVRSKCLFFRNSVRKIGSHFSWNCSKSELCRQRTADFGHIAAMRREQKFGSNTVGCWIEHRSRGGRYMRVSVPTLATHALSLNFVGSNAAAISVCVYSSRGLSKTASVGPSSTIFPCFMTIR